MSNSSTKHLPPSAGLRPPPPVEAVWLTQTTLCFDLTDGRSISVPLGFYPPLAAAKEAARNQYEIHKGTVYWAALGFKVTSADLLVGRRKE